MAIDRQIIDWNNPPSDWISYKINIPQEIRMKAGILRTLDKRKGTDKPTLRDIYLHWIEKASEKIDILSINWGYIQVKEYYNKPVLWFHPETWEYFNKVQDLIEQKKVLCATRTVSLEKIIIHFLIEGSNERNIKQAGSAK